MQASLATMSPTLWTFMTRCSHRLHHRNHIHHHHDHHHTNITTITTNVIQINCRLRQLRGPQWILLIRGQPPSSPAISFVSIRYRCHWYFVSTRYRHLYFVSTRHHYLYFVSTRYRYLYFVATRYRHLYFVSTRYHFYLQSCCIYQLMSKSSTV